MRLGPLLLLIVNTVVLEDKHIELCYMYQGCVTIILNGAILAFMRTWAVMPDTRVTNLTAVMRCLKGLFI